MFRIKTTIKNIWNIIRIESLDFRYQITYSLSSPFRDTESMMTARIMLIMHQLEKGLSHNSRRANWGKEKAYALSSNILSFYTKYPDNSRIQTAIDILEQYKEDQAASKDPRLIQKIESVLKYKKKKESSGGVKKVSEPTFLCSSEAIWQFFSTRSSVRNFSNKEIPRVVFKNAERFASLTPTACNRQSSKVYFYKDKNIISEILDTQLGDQGWCNNASALFVVVGNGSYFNASYESKQVYIDGGMFAMNFCLGLHLQKIATCFKMYVRSPKEDRRFHKVTRIPQNEIPIVLIMAGYYPNDGKEYYSPLSYRQSY